MTVKHTIPLTDEQDALVRSLVASGRYPDEGAVLRQGLELLRRETGAGDGATEAPRSAPAERREEWRTSSQEIVKLLDGLIAHYEGRRGLSSSGQGAVEPPR